MGRCAGSDVHAPAKIVRSTLFFVLVSGTLAIEARAQARPGPTDSVAIVLGAQYRAGGLRSLLWGDHYRAAWTSTVTLPLLDIAGYAGGLTPERTGGGSQTSSLILRGADGRRYMFRLIDKDPTRGLPEELRDEPIVDFLQDQVSSLHPFGPVVVDLLEDAAGVLHPTPIPFLMPDDPALGPFRDAFAGRAGMLVERLGEEVEGGPRFEDLVDVIDGDAIFDRLSGGGSRIDDTAFLTARLLDLVIGDWNRHRGQWSWGRQRDGTTWLPIALDRDHAFSRRDGIVPSAARFLVRGFVGFRETYPDIDALHFGARELDRRFLVELDRTAWDSVALALQGKLTDSIIDQAVRRLPDALYALDGPILARALKRRRDELPAAATELYDLLTEVVEIHLTDGPEEVSVTRLPEGRVEVFARSRSQGGSPSPPATRYRRLFHPSETEEIRIFLGADDDLVLVTARGGGDTRDPIDSSPAPIVDSVVSSPMILVVGGPGDDEIRYESNVLSVSFYDAMGDNRVTGLAPSRRIISKPYDPQSWQFGDAGEIGSGPPVDWGSWVVPDGRLDFSSDYGLFLGLGARRFTYGFRRDPYQRRLRLVGGISTQGKFHAELEADLRIEASARHITLQASASELDVVNFFGFGNDTRRFTTSDSADVQRRALSFSPRFGNQLSRRLDIGFGLTLEASNTVAATNPFIAPENPDLPTAVEPVEGSGGFVLAGAFADVRFDSRDDRQRATRGVLVRARASAYPGILDLSDAYGSLEASGTDLPIA